MKRPREYSHVGLRGFDGSYSQKICQERWQIKGIVPMVCVLAAWQTYVQRFWIPKLTMSDERDPEGFVGCIVILNRLGPFRFGWYSTGRALSVYSMGARLPAA